MKATYQDFLNENPKCGKDLAANTNAQSVFSLLSDESNIIKMIDASDAGQPALSPVALIVENYCTENPSENFDLTNKQRRTVVGCMIKTILSPFGYKTVYSPSKTQKDFPKSIDAKYFRSGSCYIYDPLAHASMKVVRKVIEV